MLASPFVRAYALAALVLVGAAWLTACHVETPFPWEDAFITYVYGRNLAEGHGLRYNSTDVEPTEGYSSLAHVVVAAGAHRAGVHPVAATRLAGLLALFSIPLTFGFVCARLDPGGTVAAGVIATTCAILYPFEDLLVHLQSGMDTVLFLALHAHAFALVSALALGLVPDSILVPAMSALAALLAVGRPEGAVLAIGYTAVLPLARLAGGRHARPLAGMLPTAAMVLATLAAYGAFKLAYFGHLLPNPYYVKTHHAIYGSAGVWLPGLADVGRFLSARWLPMVLAAAYAAWHLRFRRLLATFACLALPSIGALVLYGRTVHEGAAAFRYEVPLLFPVSAFLAAVATILWARHPRSLVPTLVLAWAWCPLTVQVDWLAHPLASATACLRYDEASVPLSAHAQMGIDLAESGLGQTATLWTSGAGMVPYYSRFRTIDWIGLNDNYLSGRTARTLDEVWQYAERAQPDVVYSLFPPATAGCMKREDDPAFATSRAVQQELNGNSPSTVLTRFWDPERVAEMAWREMCFVRDHYRFGACWRYRNDDVLIAYVRRDSPHATKLVDVLSRSRTADRFSDLEEGYVNDPRLHGTTPAEQQHWKREVQKALLVAALHKSPRNAQGYISLGLLEERDGRTEPAERCYRQAIEINPRLVLAHFRLASLFARSGRLPEARDALALAQSIEPANPAVRQRLEEVTRTLASTEPTTVDGWAQLGAARSRAGDRDGAEAAFGRALALAPDNYRLLVELGLLRRARGDQPGALALFGRAAAQPGASPEVWFNLGMQHALMAHAGEAHRALTEFLARWKGEPRFADEARAMIARLSAAQR